MQMIIEARLVDDVQETVRIQLAVIDREMTTSPLGLSLAEVLPPTGVPGPLGGIPAGMVLTNAALLGSTSIPGKPRATGL